ncbi:probable L-type lectin-domain containing receptor kinase V.3 [Durio zibethinus]|uniref:non-specific serine/threonine protein kinase n=1 Tax=Durio zibethinus TaxID=66656 RepID=A0A6P5WNB0_DURZI|nr:probable L-type lectin-domain containing receptor kinase V.3 [Durio zibethinus]
MPNGNLEKWLCSHNYFLDILDRFNIMIDVASALEYLHHGQTVPLVHCDLKPSNVLLDEDMVAHLSDFGIAKLLGDEDSTIQTMTLATIGYIAPDIATKDCAISILQLAIECSEELPEERIGMKEVVDKLQKIKIKFLNESNRRSS